MSNSLRYSYPIDLNSNSTAAKVLRLCGAEKKVLELGCAGGHMSQILTERGCHVVAVEIDPEAAAAAEAFCERVIVGDVEEIDIEAELGTARFDVVVAADVLEHLRNPGGLLARLKPFLEPEGYIVASLPNIAHGSVRLSLMSGSFPYSEKGLLDQTHLRFFTIDTVRSMFEEAGYFITHLDRNKLDIEHSEVPFPKPVPAAVLETLKDDPEAETYQFILVAYSFPREAIDGLRSVLSEFEAELKLGSEERKRSRRFEREISALRRRNRTLASEKHALSERLSALEKVALRGRELETRLDRLCQREESTARKIKEMTQVVQTLTHGYGEVTRELEAISEYQAGLHEHLEEICVLVHESSQTTLAAVHDRLSDASRKAGTDRDHPLPEPEDEARRFENYQRMIGRIREVVRERFPSNSRFLVVSKGDEELLKLQGSWGEHFPQREDGVYAGYYPSTAQEAIDHLKEVCSRKGVHYLLFPSVATWWLDHYKDFAVYLDSRSRRVFDDPEVCVIYELAANKGSSTPAESPAQSSPPSPLQQVVELLLPSEAPVALFVSQKESLRGWGNRQVFHLDPTAAGDAIDELQKAREWGARFLIVPDEGSGRREEPALFHAYLKSHCRCLLYRRNVGTIYSLQGGV